MAEAVSSIGPSQRPTGSTRVGSSLRATSIAKFAAQALQMLTFVCAARVLGVRTYGEYSIILAVIGFALLFNDAGLQASVVFDDSLTESKLSTAFWFNAFLGLLLSGSIWCVAGPLCSMLGQPAAAWPMAVASLSFITSLSMVPTALLERSLRFGRLAGCELLGQAVTTVFTISGAWLGLGIYSLALSPIVFTVTVTLATTLATGYRPRSKPTVTDLRSLWRFSSGMFGFSTSNYLCRNLDNFALSRFSTPFDLGIYSRAYSLTMIPVMQISLSVSRVLFPLLTRDRENAHAMRAEWRRILTPVLVIFLPLSSLMMVTSSDFVHLLFTPVWAPLATVITLLAAAAVPQMLTAGFGSVYLALGRTRLLFGLTVVNTLLIIIAIALGVHRGAVGVAIGVAAASCAYAVLRVTVGMRLLKMPVRELWSCIGPSGLVSASVGAVGAAAVLSLNALHVQQPLIRLGVTTLVCALIYAAGVTRYGGRWPTAEAAELKPATATTR